MIGNDGLSASILKEVDNALSAHGLIKIRVFSDDRLARESMMMALCEQLNAAPVQHIGKLLVIWRQIPEKQKKTAEDAMPAPKSVKVLKYSKRGGQRPEVRTVRVLGNERLTSGGKVKRVQPKQKSIKKVQPN